MALDTHRLRDRRDQLGFTNAEVAARAGIAPRYAENIMCGADRPSRKVVYRLAAALDVPAHELDPDIRAGRRTPQGDPSEPPRQPPNSPKAPPRRDERDTKGPGRVREGAAA